MQREFWKQSIKRLFGGPMQAQEIRRDRQEGKPRFGIVLLRRKWLTAAVCVLVAAAMFYVVNYPVAVGVVSAARELPIYCVQRDYKVCSLTFDAAWGNEDTELLIDILGKYNLKATFFVVGDWVDKYPESVKALSDAGHEVMNHSNKHDHMSQLSASQIVEDLEACNKKIEAVTGKKPTLMRPPFGEYDNNVITAVRSIGMEPIQWDVDSLDWKNLDAAQITKRVLDGVKPGSIVLFHNAALHTPEALEGIITALLQKGYTIVPVSELILKGAYTIDHSGRQIPAASS